MCNLSGILRSNALIRVQGWEGWTLGRGTTSQNVCQSVSEWANLCTPSISW